MNRVLILAQGWSEHDPGWGDRSDGVSLHLSVADRDAFLLTVKDRVGGGVRPDSQCGNIDVHPDVVEFVKTKMADPTGHFKNGIFLSNRDFSVLRRKGVLPHMVIAVVVPAKTIVCDTREEAEALVTRIREAGADAHLDSTEGVINAIVAGRL